MKNSREVEEQEDWEITGQEEMNRLHEKCKQNTSLLNVRDRLINLKDLITLCHESLTYSEIHDINIQVGNVLYFQVIEQIKIAEEELSLIC